MSVPTECTRALPGSMYLSKASDADWKYPQTEPYATGFLEVQGGTHRLFWAEYGNPDGEVVMCVHGGPGGGSDAFVARFFHPERYRVLMFDQRGCGKSTPSASSDNPAGALTNNTTSHLIDDINQLRAHRQISTPMHVFGGSWGSTLSLAYAIAHPANVRSLVLRGIFLCRRKDLDYFYQGNAATYATEPFSTTQPGAYMQYPEAWRMYVLQIPEAERGDMIAAYHKLFTTQPTTPDQVSRQNNAVRAWSGWEGSTSFLSLDPAKPNDYEELTFAKAFAMIENHYFINGAFLGGAGEANRAQNYILEHVDRLVDIPIYVVHGRFDNVCPMFQADELVSALERAGHKHIHYRRTPAGHSMTERENCHALTDILDHL